MPYMFNRSARLGAGKTLDSMAWAVKITEKVNNLTGSDTSLWTTSMSPQVGLLSWNTIVEDYAELMTANDKLMADSGYLDLLEEGAQYADGNGADDVLIRLVHAEPPAEPAQFASITTSRAAAGQMASALALGVEMAQRITAITGRPALFGASVTGDFGGIGFMVLSETIEQVQAANETLATDADWIKMVDQKASVAFEHGATRTISRRIA